jgi:hypothetical protein
MGFNTFALARSLPRFVMSIYKAAGSVCRSHQVSRRSLRHLTQFPFPCNPCPEMASISLR